MALPTVLKTWEFRTNVFVNGYINTHHAHKNLAVTIKKVLCNQVTGLYATGNIQLVSGTTFRINPNPGGSNSVLDKSFIGNMVGKKVRLTAMTTAGNNGTFTITAHADIGTNEWVVDFTNATGVAEAITGSVEVLGNWFTNPWVPSWTHKATGSSDMPTTDDGVDRIWEYTDYVTSTTSWSAFCIRNPVTGSYWMMSGHSDSGSYLSRRSCVYSTTAPNQILAPPNSSTDALGTPNRAGGTNLIVWQADNNWWFNSLDSAFNSRVHGMMSDDGEQTRLAACAYGVIPMGLIDGVIRNPHAQWTHPTVIEPVFHGWFSYHGNADEWTYGTLNDGALVRGSSMNDPFPPSPQGETIRHNPTMYLTTEGYIDGANGQKWSGVNELSGNYDVTPIGLFTTDLGIRTRLGEVPDMWYNPTGMDPGMTAPLGGSKQFACFGDLLLPWDGSFMELG